MSKPPNAERQTTGLCTKRRRPYRKIWLRLLRCGGFMVLVLRTALVIVGIFTEAEKLWQALKDWLR